MLGKIARKLAEISILFYFYYTTIKFYVQTLIMYFFIKEGG